MDDKEQEGWVGRNSRKVGGGVIAEGMRRTHTLLSTEAIIAARSRSLTPSSCQLIGMVAVGLEGVSAITCVWRYTAQCYVSYEQYLGCRERRRLQG
jgi:hypothetical protein